MAWRNQSEARSKTPTADAIYKHWAKKGLPPAKGDATNYLEKYTCFACGSYYHRQRAHIIPICDGGDNSLDNLHLLCQSCHSRSEGNKKYWTWLAYMRTHEWKSRYEWVMKTLEMNGVNIDEEAEKCKDMSIEERLSSLKQLLYDNGIRLIPKGEDDL